MWNPFRKQKQPDPKPEPVDPRAYDGLRVVASLLGTLAAVYYAPPVDVLKEALKRVEFDDDMGKTGKRHFKRMLKLVVRAAKLREQIAKTGESEEAKRIGGLTSEGAEAFLAKHERRGDLADVVSEDEIRRLRERAGKVAEKP